jgi:hypothetical protein
MVKMKHPETGAEKVCEFDWQVEANKEAGFEVVEDKPKKKKSK